MVVDCAGPESAPAASANAAEKPDERTGCEQPDDDRAYPHFHVVSVDTNIDGLFVTTASTPAFSTRSRSSRLVDRPRDHRRAARMRPPNRRRADEPVVKHEHGRASSCEQRSHQRGCERAERAKTTDSRPARSRACRRCRADPRGRTRRPACVGSSRARSRSAPRWKELTRLRSTSPNRASARATSGSADGDLRSTWTPTSRRLLGEERSASSSVGSSWAELAEVGQRHRADDARLRPRGSARAGRPSARSRSRRRASASTSNSTRSTPAATAARNPASVFSGASAAAPWWPITSGRPSRRSSEITATGRVGR